MSLMASSRVPADAFTMVAVSAGVFAFACIDGVLYECHVFSLTLHAGAVAAQHEHLIVLVLGQGWRSWVTDPVTSA